MFEPLKPYADMGAALYPIQTGTKDGYLLGSWAHDWSRDPTQWSEWADRWPGCNWIMIAGPSNKIIVDIDVKTVGRDAAWAAWCEWCANHECPFFAPQIGTPSGGWHLYFDCPDQDLAQPALIKGVIDIRAGNGYVLIPPSQIEGKPYAWL